MKFFSSIICFVLALFLCSSAFGASEAYVRAGIGHAMPDDSKMSFDEGGQFDIRYDDGRVFSLATGTSVNRIRQELEITYQENDMDTAMAAGGDVTDLQGDAWRLSLMLNGYFDLTNRTPFTPFLTIGIGLALVEVSDVFSPGDDHYLKSENNVVLAYQGGGGIGWRVHDKVVLDLGYCYFATQDPDFEVAEMDFASHNVYFGARLIF